jgi:hypothetical protein
MVDRITRLDRRIGIVIVIVGVILILSLVLWLVTSIVGGDESPGGVTGGSEDWMLPQPGELGPDGQPIIPVAELVAQAVQATMEAIPTPTPAPTPNIAATLQAEMALNRKMVSPVLMLNPLDLKLDRDPYLTSNELRYFRELGPRLWAYTRVWLHLQEVLSVDIAEWDFGVLEHDLGRAQALLESAPDRPQFERGGRGQPVDRLVRAYSDSIETGMTGVREAVARLSDAEDVLAGPVGHSERDELLRIAREVQDLLADFDSAMSAYGCSVCGELFRRVEER